MRMRDHIPEHNELPPMSQQELDEVIRKHNMFTSGQIGGARAVVQYRDLSQLDFKEADLSQADFTGCLLSGADFTRANLQSITFFSCDMRNADMTDANMTRADLRGAYLGGANLTRANLKDADLRSGKIMKRGKHGVLEDRQKSNHESCRTVLCGAKLTETNLRNIQGKSADFSDADMTGVVMTNADLEEATFDGANLTDSDASNSNLKNATMRSSVIAGMLLEGIDKLGIDITGAIKEHQMGQKLENLEKPLAELLDIHTLWVSTVGQKGRQLDLSEYDLRDVLDLRKFPLTAIRAVGANFLNQDLRSAELQSGVFDHADFRDCNMEEADLRGSSYKFAQFARSNLSFAKMCPLQFEDPQNPGKKRLQRTDMSGANFRFCNILHADLRDCIFMGADLTNAIIRDCDLRRADFTGAILTGLVFENVKLDDAIIDLTSI